jgi:2-polyprenyl-6-methoxyphenol hydroxylase-like FAD-dependent oxidoreductase
LAAAAGLARRGWSVEVIERDVAPSTDHDDEAFLEWERPDHAELLANLDAARPA